MARHFDGLIASGSRVAFWNQNNPGKKPIKPWHVLPETTEHGSQLLQGDNMRCELCGPTPKPVPTS